MIFETLTCLLCTSVYRINGYVWIWCVYQYDTFIIFNIPVVMNYNAITRSIQDLTLSLSSWSSTVCIPINGSNQFLDISSAAKGSNSTTPVGAINQPNKFPTGERLGSFYRFDPALYTGPDSWDDLKTMLCKTGCVSGCKISTTHTRPETSSRKKLIPFLVSMGGHMNQEPTLPLHQVLSVRTMWLDRRWSVIRLEEQR